MVNNDALDSPNIDIMSASLFSYRRPSPSALRGVAIAGCLVDENELICAVRRGHVYLEICACFIISLCSHPGHLHGERSKYENEELPRTHPLPRVSPTPQRRPDCPSRDIDVTALPQLSLHFIQVHVGGSLNQANQELGNREIA
jgi:hypothetical protein